MNNDRNLLALAVAAGLVIGWLLGAGWWHVPGRSLGVLLAILLIVVLVRRSRGVQNKPADVADPNPVSQSVDSKVAQSKEAETPDMKTGADGEVLSPEAARQWLDDLLVEQQED